MQDYFNQGFTAQAKPANWAQMPIGGVAPPVQNPIPVPTGMPAMPPPVMDTYGKVPFAGATPPGTPASVPGAGGAFGGLPLSVRQHLMDKGGFFGSIMRRFGGM